MLNKFHIRQIDGFIESSVEEADWAIRKMECKLAAMLMDS